MTHAKSNTRRLAEADGHRTGTRAAKLRTRRRLLGRIRREMMRGTREAHRRGIRLGRGELIVVEYGNVDRAYHDAERLTHLRTFERSRFR